jgi:hypothetical protein
MLFGFGENLGKNPCLLAAGERWGVNSPTQSERTLGILPIVVWKSLKFFSARRIEVVSLLVVDLLVLPTQLILLTLE